MESQTIPTSPRHHKVDDDLRLRLLNQSVVLGKTHVPADDLKMWAAVVDDKIGSGAVADISANNGALLNVEAALQSLFWRNACLLLKACSCLTCLLSLSLVNVCDVLRLTRA